MIYLSKWIFDIKKPQTSCIVYTALLPKKKNILINRISLLGKKRGII